MTPRMNTWIPVAFCLALATSGLQAESTGLHTEDGLGLQFASDGTIEAVLIDDARLAVEAGGVYLKDISPAAEAERMGYRTRSYRGVPARGTLERTGRRRLRLSSTLPGEGLRVAATYRAERGYIRIDCEITNVADKERAIIAYFRLPVGAEGTRWWRSLHQSERIEADTRYLNPHMTHQAYRPWGSRSIFTAVTGLPAGGSETGLSLVVPMDAPRWFRSTYERGFGYQVEVELGLSPLTEKFPNGASFSVLLYRVDPRWGLRSTVERYQEFFPDFYVRRIEKGGTWYFDHPSAPLETELDNPEDFALRFKETYVWANETTRARGVLAMKYVEPWCDHYFGTEDWMRKQALDLPANNLWAPTGKSQPVRVQAQALLISGVRREDGSLWGPNHSEFRSRNPGNMVKAYGEHWPQVKQVLGTDKDLQYGYRYPTNPDLELPGMCRGKSVMQYEVYNQWGRKPASPDDVYDGIYYDSTGGWWTGWHLNNFNRRHFASADFPLVFDHKTGEVALLHGLSCIEFLKYLSGVVHQENKVTMANSGPGIFINFAAPYLDMMGVGEGYARGDYDGRWLIRSVAGTKPLSYLKNPGIAEQDFHECLPFAVYPGGPSTKGEWGPLRPLYRKYVPLLDRLDQAGWHPVPGAVVEGGDVFVERFGPEPSGAVLFVAHNMGDDSYQGKLRLLDQDLAVRVPGWTGYARVRELISGRELETQAGSGALEVPVKLASKESWVLEATPLPPPRPALTPEVEKPELELDPVDADE